MKSFFFFKELFQEKYYILKTEKYNDFFLKSEILMKQVETKQFLFLKPDLIIIIYIEPGKSLILKL